MSESTDPARIERDLDQTRSRLENHLGELQSRLSPGQVLDDVIKFFRGSEGAEFGRNLLDNVKANPLPAAVAGIGLTWLMASNSSNGSIAPASARGGTSVVRPSQWSASKRGDVTDDLDARVKAAEAEVSRRPYELETSYVSRLEDARGQVVGVTRHPEEPQASFSQRVRSALSSAQEAVVNSVHDIKDQAGETAASATEAVSGAAASARTAAGSVTSTVSDAAQRVGAGFSKGGQSASQLGGQTMTALAESPILLGALGLAAGALLGMLLPQSEQEEGALSGVAGQARDAARSTAQGVVDGGGHVAQAVIEATRQGVASHGVADASSAGELVDDALSGKTSTGLRNIASDVLKSGNEAIEKELTAQKQAGEAARTDV